MNMPARKIAGLLAHTPGKQQVGDKHIRFVDLLPTPRSS